MGLIKDWWLNQLEAEFEPDRVAAEAEAGSAKSREVAARRSRERVWAVRHPNEWEEWVRIRALVSFSYDFSTGKEFDFDDFLMEVGRQPSPGHVVVRMDEAVGYEAGNMRWAVGAPEPSPCPYLNVKQAAAFLGVSVQTVYNNRKHIPSLPGFRTLMFDPKVLEEIRASNRFRSKRLADQKKARRSQTC